MENDAHKNLSSQYTARFGKFSLYMGLVTAEQLTDALAEQAEDSLSNRPHRFIGSILFEREELTKWNPHPNWIMLTLHKDIKLNFTDISTTLFLPS